jgi:hypothetical protein
MAIHKGTYDAKGVDMEIRDKMIGAEQILRKAGLLITGSRDQLPTVESRDSAKACAGDEARAWRYERGSVVGVEWDGGGVCDGCREEAGGWGWD